MRLKVMVKLLLILQAGKERLDYYPS